MNQIYYTWGRGPKKKHGLKETGLLEFRGIAPMDLEFARSGARAEMAKHGEAGHAHAAHGAASGPPPQLAAAPPTPSPATTDDDAGTAPLVGAWSDADLADILTALALGHSLRGTASPLS